MKRTSLAIFAALICTSGPFAIDQALAQQSGASSPSGSLDGFVGDAICTGNMMAMGKTPGHATTSKYSGEKILDGHWVVIHYDEDQTAANTKPFHVVQYIGYNAAKKRFIAVAFDNSNVGYSTGTSPGWKGDAFTLDNTQSMDGKTVDNRDVFTKSDSGMSSHAGTMRDKHGKWVKTDEETCHKA